MNIKCRPRRLLKLSASSERNALAAGYSLVGSYSCLQVYHLYVHLTTAGLLSHSYFTIQLVPIGLVKFEIPHLFHFVGVMILLLQFELFTVSYYACYLLTVNEGTKYHYCCAFLSQ